MGPGFFETLDRNRDGLVPPAELQADLARGLTLGRDAGIIVSDLLPGGLAERVGGPAGGGRPRHRHDDVRCNTQAKPLRIGTAADD